MLAGFLGRRVIVESVDPDSAIVRVEGMTSDFAYATLKYGVNNPAIRRRVEAACGATVKAYICNGDQCMSKPSGGNSNILVFILLTADHQLVVTTDPEFDVSDGYPAELLSINFCSLTPRQGHVMDYDT
jgi:hypothetical protein